jgi:hypothetical protein
MRALGSKPARKDPGRSAGRRIRLAVATGFIAMAAYLVGAHVSGSIDPLARRPIFDGFAPPPPYRWVSPPPSLAHGNVKPASGSFRVKFGPKGVSQPEVLSTNDLQASVILSDGAFVPMAGQTSVMVTITPIATDPRAETPTGLRIIGNVYRFSAAYQPGGGLVTALSNVGQLTLAAPPSTDGLIHPQALLSSKDGKTWTRLLSSDGITQVGADVRSFGYFVVAETVAGGKKPFPLARIVYSALIVGLVLLIGIPIAVHEIRSRRSRRGSRRPRRR